MDCFTKKLNLSPEYKTIVTGIRKNRLPMGVLGLSHIHKANLTASLHEDFPQGAIIITPDESQASRLVSDLAAFGRRAMVFPARDFVFRSTEGRSREYEHLRLGVLDKMLSGEFDIVVCSVEAAMQLTIPKEELEQRRMILRNGDEISIEAIISLLLRAGYTRSQQVDGSGQFAVRGGILDFFTPNCDMPCRVEFWGDSIDSMAFFDVESQRRTDSVESIKIIPLMRLCLNQTIC
jgi:transcription-repair coupling factor (superfamily II helicase)